MLVVYAWILSSVFARFVIAFLLENLLSFMCKEKIKKMMFIWLEMVKEEAACLIVGLRNTYINNKNFTLCCKTCINKIFFVSECITCANKKIGLADACIIHARLKNIIANKSCMCNLHIPVNCACLGNFL